MLSFLLDTLIFLLVIILPKLNSILFRMSYYYWMIICKHSSNPPAVHSDMNPLHYSKAREWQHRYELTVIYTSVSWMSQLLHTSFYEYEWIKMNEWINEALLSFTLNDIYLAFHSSFLPLSSKQASIHTNEIQLIYPRSTSLRRTIQSGLMNNWNVETNPNIETIWTNT